MDIAFANDLPVSDPVIISGPDSLNLNGREYLIVSQDDSEKNFYEIRYDVHCSPFKQAIIADNVLAVGYEEYFYLFDLSANTNILRLKMEGYFGHLYTDNGFFYLADAQGLYKIDKKANLNWHNNNLAIDGVIVTEFTPEKIKGSGEWDPPGGWRDFILNKETGIIIN